MTLTIKEDRTRIIEIENKALTLRDIIKLKIENEIKLYNDKLMNGSVNIDITDIEKKLNTAKNKNKKLLDNIENRIATGIEAFENKEYFVLVGEKQIENLDELIELKENTDITFIKLIPLIGG